ncbi:neuropeptide-like 3 [Drosophila montana]|uniref:neuropeptide-like 3 n=1 Tax=Drosophila montana TaxID=40370 RepID=UPI00313EB13E
MFKLVVLSALLAVVAARPGYLEAGPLLHTSYAAPAIIHEPALASVGHIVKSIPTSVSHQSISQVHSSAHIVQPILAPVVKTYAAPIYKTYAAPALHTSILSPSWASHGWASSW